ncbi:ATP-dependent DNA ligase [Cryobacterium melibiosiphilum]|uniref:DNA ligase (ATP) n=1 Tax=Cryobacterium melibiosiphilum TaxID=995039 RepID=A0A3A5MIT8_9MICO|nr:ATP-dependent DNA ligase [Cryobacterium melibiosiphilum]RJT88801.1 ATP-dependent DNA ligase [Cryobacterium melibiosiphilum]
MTDARQVVTVNGHRITLTHLDKVMYPETGTTKAEVLAYYANVAPALIRYTANRPATRKRWVHGVGSTDEPGAVFFQKNLEEGAPDWVRRLPIQHTDRISVYPLVNDLATLTWLAQLSALEIHVPQWQFAPGGEARNPDRLVLDLDPGPGVGLADCAEIARFARTILQGAGLEPMPVTSGSKGIHLYAPLDGRYSAEQVVLVAHELARALEVDHPDRVVSGMSKALRPGKVFVDWSQNSAAKTTIAPYSLRGRARPTVAAPRHWAELDSPGLAQLEFGEVVERLARLGDPLAVIMPGEGSSDEAIATVDDRLTAYRDKRRADRTPEPVPARPAATGAATDAAASVAPAPVGSATGTSFVIHEHHARRLHWDLRFERDGVLVSWALPKGVPSDSAHNHLAVHTEDHPLEYGSFEGTIPTGEYGAGQIFIWDHGEYELEKWRDDEVIATLHGQPGGSLGGPRRVALIQTGGGAGSGDAKAAQNWLIHLMKPTGPQSGAGNAATANPTEARPGAALTLPDYVSPMLATAGSERDLGEDAWAFEMKWDGIRAIALLDGAGGVRLLTRNGNDVTASYPEIVAGLRATVPVGSAVLDGEIVALDRSGRPSFGLLQTRMNLGAAEARAAGLRVPVHYLLFDVLERHGQALMAEPYDARRAVLDGLLATTPDGARIQVPPALEGDYADALRTSRVLGLEGFVAKLRTSAYSPGRRSRSWIKVKHTLMQEVVIGGWRPGTGNRANTVGALLLGIPGASARPGELVYVGRVGTGFSERDLSAAHALLEPLAAAESPFLTMPRLDARDAHWVQPVLVGEVEFGEWTPAGRLRHPSWRGWRTDKEPADVRAELPTHAN